MKTDVYDFFTISKKILDERESFIYSSYATSSNAAIRRIDDNNSHSSYRQAFSIDADRIMHSSAYARYMDKTQVFSLSSNDHITHRMLHVQLVSKIARTIGRFLFANEDLIESIALGHDIGHPPFGHDGEVFLSKLCKDVGIGNFLHNVQSVQFLDRVENKGKGWNLTLQTLDGILCHDGERHDQVLIPNFNKTFKSLESEIFKKKENPTFKIVPMTLEGCIVRLADTISYVGRDLEDAIRMNILRRSDLPIEISNYIGNTNGTIVHRLVTDIIKNSQGKKIVGFSSRMSCILKKLKEFNLQHIYTNSKIKKHYKTIENLFAILFETCMKDIETRNVKSKVFSCFLDGMSEDYIHSHESSEITRDYIAGMTDRYFLSQFDEGLW